MEKESQQILSLKKGNFKKRLFRCTLLQYTNKLSASLTASLALCTYLCSDQQCFQSKKLTVKAKVKNINQTRFANFGTFHPTVVSECCRARRNWKFNLYTLEKKYSVKAYKRLAWANYLIENNYSSITESGQIKSAVLFR